MKPDNINEAQEFISAALRMRENNEKESRLRENFTFYLGRMFDPHTKWVRAHVEGGEEAVHLIRGQRTVNGFIDNCLDAIAIEYERNLYKQSVFEEGYRQVKEYCASLIREGINIDIIEGVLSDTLSWHIYKVIPNEGMAKREYSENNIQLQEIDSLDIRDNSRESAIKLLLFLPKYIGRMKSRFVSAKNIANDFGLDSKYSENFREACSSYIQDCAKGRPDYYNMILNLWGEFVQKIDKDETITNNLSYGLEFYVSTLAKLLCANFVEKDALLSDDEELISILNGTFFENRGYLHFVEYDYFGWLNERDNINHLLSTAKAMQEELCAYDFSQNPNEDLFGEVMVQMSQHSKRILLGQELTPTWLAKRIVDHVYSLIPDNENKVLIDMCCGSGSMIIEATNLAMQNNSDSSDGKSLGYILSNSITGIDIDPLAVILSKINWIICVAEFKERKHIDEVSIPIYHADSLFINTPVTEGGTNHNELHMRLMNKRIDLPSFLITPSFQGVFDEIVDKCYDLMHGERWSEDRFNPIVHKIIEGLQINKEQVKAILVFAFHLYESLYELNKEGKNGVWSFLIKNSFRPSLIGGIFTGIVSNTPWLALSKLSSNPYKVALNYMAAYYGIKPTDSSFLHTELSTVFLVHAIDKYLKDGMAFGCILPSNIMAGNQHEKFRDGSYKHVKFDIEEIWQIPNDTFSNKAIAVFGHKVSYKSKTSIPCSSISEDGNNFNQKIFVNHAFGNVSWSLEKSSSIEHRSYHFDQGADVLPRYLFFFNLEDKGNSYKVSSINSGSKYAYFLQNMHKGQNYNLPIARVDKRLFHPVIVSNVLLPFKITELPLALLPIKRTRSGWLKLSEDDKAFFNRSTNNTLREIDRTYRRSEKNRDIYISLNWLNKLENQEFDHEGYMVIYGAGGAKPCAAVLDLSSIDKLPIVDQTCYYRVVTTEDEAMYLVGLINSKAMEDSIVSSQAEGRFGKRHIHTLVSDVPPKFNKNNSYHMELVEYVKQITSELYALVSSLKPDLVNPNNGSLPTRRRKIKEILAKLPIYQEYEGLCRSIINE